MVKTRFPNLPMKFSAGFSTLKFFFIHMLVFTKFLRKKKQATKLPSTVLCDGKETSRHLLERGGTRLCVSPNTPVYYTYFYTKYFNNTSCKGRLIEDHIPEAVDRARRGARIRILH